MLKSERIAKTINKNIAEWTGSHSKLVVAMDGYAGSGKTTIADFIAEQNSNVLVVHLDDFIHHWKKRKKIIEGATDKSQVFEHQWYRYTDIEKLIKAFKTKNKGDLKLKTYDYAKNEFGPLRRFDLSKKILLIEGVFLLHPEHLMSKLLDRTIYLDIDLAKADKQRVTREKKHWGNQYTPETHNDNWTKYYKKAYQRYIKECQPNKNCDLNLTT